MREKIKQLASVIIVLVLVAGGILYFSKVTERKDADIKYNDFFEKETEYDILFFGTSHVINAVFPMQLWNDYGITSYNFGGHSNSIAASYWVYENAIEYHKPKIAVLDVLGVGQSYKEMDVSYAHMSFDAFPYTATKKEAIEDIFEDKKQQQEMLFPFSIYHSRWHMLEGEDYIIWGSSDEAGKEKGAESRIAVAIPEGEPLVDKNQKLSEDTVGKQYIRKFIQSCRENGIEPVLMYLPFPTIQAMQMWGNSVYDLAKEENVPFLNLRYEDVVDYTIDCYDPSSHLNPSGARKVTEYLGEYLCREYGLEDKRQNDNFQIWNVDYEEYRQMLFQNIQEEENLKSTLMLLNNSNFRADIICSLDYELDEVAKKLLEQIDADIEWKNGKISDSQGDIFIKVYDVKTNEVVTVKEFTFGAENIKNISGEEMSEVFAGE